MIPGAISYTRGGYRFKPLEQGTRFTLVSDVEPTGFISFWDQFSDGWDGVVTSRMLKSFAKYLSLGQKS